DGVLRGSVDLDAEGSASVAAGQWAVPGSHTFSAQNVDPSYPSEWSTATINFRLLLHSTTTISTTIARTYVGGTLPTITAHVTGAATTRGGTLRILNNTTGRVLGTVLRTKTSRAITITPTLPVGENLLVAEFSGSLTEAASSSAVFVTVLPANGVALLKVTVTPTTFYPYQDGYLDTVSIGGTLDEVATVSVAVYNAGGTRVFLANLGSKNGAYSTTWNGRNGSGAMLPAGAYKVVQTLRDTTGHSRTENTSV